MASKKKAQLTKYCRIFQYVEALDSNFAGAIRDLCMEGALSPGFGGAGVTFLYPKEKAYREDITSKAYSDDADDAVKMIESLIIPDALHSATEWKRRPIGSHGSPGVLYEVTDTSGSVTLKGEGGKDVKLEHDDEFKLLARREGEKRLAVWTVVSGRLPLTGPEYKRPRRERKEGGARAATRGGDEMLSDRARLATETEARFDEAMRKDRARSHNPYLSRVTGLLSHLKAKAPDLLLSIMPMLDWSPEVTFYILVEPYKTKTADYVIPDSVLFGPGAWNGAEAFGDAVSEFKGIMNSLATQGQFSAQDPVSGSAVVPYVFRDSSAVASQIDVVRQQIIGQGGSAANKVRTPKLVHEVYQILITSNQIAGLGPILPDATLRLEPGSKKLWQDELRFVFHSALQEVRSMPRYSTQEFAKLVRMLRFDRPGDNYGKEASLASAEALKASVAPNAEFGLMLKFINSTDFLYVPQPEGKIGGAYGDPIDPTDLSVYNRNYDALATLSRMRVAPRPVIDARAFSQLEAYARQYGALPPEVMALVGARAAPS